MSNQFNRAKTKKKERNKSNSNSGQFPRPRTLYGGMAISIGSETGVQTAAHLIVKNNYEQARRKRVRTEKKHTVRMQAGK